MPETQKTAGSSVVVEQAAESSLLDQIVEQGRFGDPTARERGKGLIKEWDPLESTCRHASLSIL